jgi:DNA replication licensing factor MCM2
VTGIYRNNYDYQLNIQHGFPVFSTVIEANHIGKKKDILAGFQMSEEDVRAIRHLATEEKIGEKVKIFVN